MEVRRVPPDCWCCCCDNDYATVEISHNDGSFKLFWAHNPNDRELCLCEKCFQELKRQINELEDIQ